MKIRNINYRNEAQADVGCGGGSGAAFKSGIAASAVVSEDTRIAINTEFLQEAIEAANTLKTRFTDAREAFDAYVRTAAKEPDHWIPDYVEANAHYRTSYPSSFYDERGFLRNDMVEADKDGRRDTARYKINGAKSKYNLELADMKSYYKDNVEKAQEKAEKLFTHLDHIRSVIESFEGLSSKIDFGDYLSIALEYYQNKGTFQVAPDVHAQVNQDTDEIEYTNDRTGQTYTSNQGRNAGRTVANDAYTVAVAIYVSEQRDFPPEMTEAMIYSSMAKTDAIVANGMENGWFDLPEGMTWDEYNRMRYEELTGEEWDPEKYRETLNEYFAALGLDIDDLNAGLFAAIGGVDGMDPSMASFVAAGLTMAGGSLYDFSHEEGFMTPEQQEMWADGLTKSAMGMDEIKAAEQAVEQRHEAMQQHALERAQEEAALTSGTAGGSGGSGGSGGPDYSIDFTSQDGDAGGGGSGGTGPGTGDEATIGDKITGVIDASSEVLDVSGDKIPATINPDIAKSIDQQAAEIYFNRSPEEIAAERANALSAVDMAFSGENVEEFKDVLRQGGFSDVDIDVIMNNKEIAVTAYILASESKSLTDIANQLAVANNIQNFDTMYDNGLNRMSLENGLSQSKLMAEVDDSVQDARTNVQHARNKYNESVKKANDSIEDAEKKKKEMEEVKKRIIEKSGEDPSKWDDDDVEAYNKAIEEYNKANKLANEAHTEAMNNKELLDQAETKLQETQDKVAQEYLNQNGAESNEPGVEPVNEGGGEPAKPVEEQPDPGVPGKDTEEVTPSEEVTLEGPNDGPGNPPKEELDTGDINLDEPGTADLPEPQEETLDEEISFVEHDGGGGTRGGTPNYDNVEPERKLTTDDIMSLFDGLDDVSSMSSAERTLDAVDLSSLAPEDRVIPGMGVTDVIAPTSDNISDMNAMSHQILPSEGRGEILENNGIAAFADSAASQANKKTDEFKDNKFNGMSGFSMNTQGMRGLETTSTTTSSSSSSSGEKKNESKNESVAGVKVEASDVKKHTDGVLVDQDDKVASEVSEDGRSLEFVEID